MSMVPGKLMVCMGHRLQCKIPNCTNHKFPGYGAEIFERERNQCSVSKTRPLNLPGQFIVRTTHFHSEIGQSHSEIPVQSSHNERFGGTK